VGKQARVPTTGVCPVVRKAEGSAGMNTASFSGSGVESGAGGGVRKAPQDQGRFSLFRSVRSLIPRSAAALVRLSLVASRAFRISTSSAEPRLKLSRKIRVLGVSPSPIERAAAEGSCLGPEGSGRAGARPNRVRSKDSGVKVSESPRITALSTSWASSRTFPGQEYRCRTSMVLGATPENSLPFSSAERAAK